MNSSKILTSLLNISIFLISLGLIALIGLLIYTAAGGNIKYPLDMFDSIVVNSRIALLTFISYTIILYSFIIYLIYLIKKLVNSLISGRLFTRYQIAGFRLIGQLIIWFIVVKAIIEFIFRIIFQAKLEINFDFLGFWLFIALGAFFMLLSKVFENARIIKEDNDLTV